MGIMFGVIGLNPAHGVIFSVQMPGNMRLLQSTRGLILFWLLIEKRAVRITPPLTITDKEIEEGCDIILNILDTI